VANALIGRSDGQKRRTGNGTSNPEVMLQKAPPGKPGIVGMVNTHGPVDRIRSGIQLGKMFVKPVLFS
jgi:hypothetical protein